MFSSRSNPVRMQINARRFGALLAVRILLFAGLFALAISGCKTSKHSSDPRLRAIDEMLDKELPKGTNMERVNLFLNERDTESKTAAKRRPSWRWSGKLIRKRFGPENARVTFHFDAHINYRPTK